MPDNRLENETSPEKVRWHLQFYGTVQGVGFRYRAYYAAQALRLTGWVKNCWDDSVEMEVQGTEKEIWKMIAMIRQGTYIEITHMKKKQIPTEESEGSFRIR